MNDEILRKVAMLEDIEEAYSECVLTWRHRVEVQRVQKIVLSSMKEAKEFDAIWQNTKIKHKCETMCNDKS